MEETRKAETPSCRMSPMRTTRRGRMAAASLLFLVLLLSLWGLGRCFSRFDDRIFTRVEEVPETEIGVVLGTSPTVWGRRNWYFVNRMEAAAELYHAGRVRKLLLTGSSRPGEGYDEIVAMRSALQAKGVPAEALLADGAGHRTILSVLGLRDRFHLASCLVISQRFHCERAMYLGQHAGIQMMGFAARDVRGVHRVKRWFRETAARCYALWEVFCGKLGER